MLVASHARDDPTYTVGPPNLNDKHPQSINICKILTKMVQNPLQVEQSIQMARSSPLYRFWKTRTSQWSDAQDEAFIRGTQPKIITPINPDPTINQPTPQVGAKPPSAQSPGTSQSPANRTPESANSSKRAMAGSSNPTHISLPS